MIPDDGVDGKPLPDGHNGARGPETPSARGYFQLDGTYLSLPDEKELTARRGFTRETLAALRYFSVTEADLPEFGVSGSLSELPSTITIPFLTEECKGRYLCRIHKRSGTQLRYPAYVTPVPSNAAHDIIIAESEIKGGVVFQLGDRGIGLQGAASFARRIPELANHVRRCAAAESRIYVLPDLEYLLKDGRREPHPAFGDMLALARGMGIELDREVRVMLLPERYLVEGRTGKGEPKLKADLDGCVAAGMSADEWRTCKDTAVAPHALDLPLPFLVGALAKVYTDDFLDGNQLSDRMRKATAEETADTCRALGAVLASRSYDASAEKFDGARYESFRAKAVQWARRNGLRGVTKRSFGGPDAGKDGGADLLALCMRETDRGVVLVKSGVETEVVASFSLVKARYGFVHFLGAAPKRRYVAEVRITVGGKPTARTVMLDEDLCDAVRYLKADPDLIIADQKHWRMYVGEKVRCEGFQQHDRTLDTPLFVGVSNEGGRYTTSASIAFPRGEQDCWFHGILFPEAGSASTAFHEVAKISRYNDVAFAHMLGAPLKASLGAYPHGSWVGNRYTAKSSTVKGIEARTGLKSADAPKQLSSNYRQLRVLGNHNLAVPLDELHRLPERFLPSLVAHLNTSYNGQYCTHGPDGHYYLAGCGILIGQDRGFEDEALETKQIVVHFALEDLDIEALKHVRKTVTPFPVGPWLRFLAANSSSAQDRLNARTDFLRERLTSSGTDCTHADRHLFNYAAVLVSADYLREFGVVLDIEVKVVTLCRFHLAGRLHAADEHPAATSCAERFLRDLLDVLQVQQHRLRLAGAVDVKPTEGVWFALTPAFDFLKEMRPNRYDVRNAARLGEAITAEFSPKGMVKKKHTFGAVRTDAWLVPAPLCAELGVELVGDVGGSGATQVD